MKKLLLALSFFVVLNAKAEGKDFSVYTFNNLNAEFVYFKISVSQAYDHCSYAASFKQFNVTGEASLGKNFLSDNYRVTPEFTYTPIPVSTKIDPETGIETITPCTTDRKYVSGVGVVKLPVSKNQKVIVRTHKAIKFLGLSL